MADQDDFTFDEQDSDSEEWYEEEEPKKEKGGGSRSRLLLLLLLLVALGGGAYYYFMILPMDGPGPAAPPKAVVKMTKKPMNMPAKQKISKPAPMPAEQAAKEEKSSDMQPAAPEQAKAPAPAKMPIAPKPMQKDAAPAEVPVKVAEKSAPAPVSSTPKQELAPKKVFETPAPKSASTPGGAYTLTAGTYLLDSSVKSVSKKIRSLGYDPVLTPVKRKVTMTRLKVGTYSLSEAAARKADLKPVAPGVFGIRKGDMETVYAGSFLVLDKARRYADKLFTKGVKVEEQSAQIEKTLQRITFGSFASSDAAGDAGRQAVAKGVEAKVVKNR